MFRELVLFVCVFFTFLGSSQNWNNFNEPSATDCNHSIAIPVNSTININGEPITNGDLIGVFYNNGSELALGGLMTWSGVAENIAAWGSEGGANNGFQIGDEYIWYVYDIETEQSILASNVQMLLGDNIYSCNGLSAVSVLSFLSEGCSDPTACNYCDSCFEFDDSLCEYSEDLIYDCDNNCFNDLDGDDVCDELEILGCTEESAANYNSNATEDDNTCDYVILGCTNSIAANYNSNATDNDGTCLYCSDPNADNFYSGNDGTFCLDDFLNNYTLEIESDGLLDCCFYANPGCTDDGSCFDGSAFDGINFAANGQLDDYECDDRFLYTSDSGELLYYQSPFPNVEAANYNPNANILVGVDYCYYFPACQDPSAMNYGYNCNGEDILSDAQTFGFSIDFNEEPGTSIFSIIFNQYEFSFENSENCCLYYGCDDVNADNFHDIDGDFYQNLPEEENFSPPGTINYNLLFNLDGTYEVFNPDLPDWANVISFVSPNDIDGDGILNNIDNDIDGDSFNYIFQYSNQIDIDSFTPCIYLGCTDGGDTEDGDGIIAYNYDSNANINDGSCEYYVCDDTDAMNYIPPCTDESACNFGMPQIAGEPQGCLYPEPESDCSDAFIARNYCYDDFYDNQIFIPIPDNLYDCCQYLGCLDPNSFNYNSEATIQELVFISNDLGSYSPIPILSSDDDTLGYEDTCYPYIYGCTDNLAENFNDYNDDGESAAWVEDDITVWQLTDVNFDANGSSLFGIDNMDIIEVFNLSGNNTNVNSLPPGNINSVNPCQYIYGCMDPCYIEYYEVIEYNDQNDFNFSLINNTLNENGCDFEYSYGCTELLIPNPQPTFDDGSCTNLLVYGCMDSNAANYNPNATINDCSSCIPAIEIDFSINNAECYDDINGDFSWTVAGGVPPYQFTLYDNDGDIVEEIVLQENIENTLNLDIGEYFVEVTDELNYTQSVSFPILESPEFVIDLWDSGGWLTTQSGYDNYEWTLDGNVLNIDSNSFQIIPSSSGVYGVTASYNYNNNICVSNSAFINFIVFENNLEDTHNLVISCMPNPSTGRVVLNINNDYLEPVYFELFDGFGNQLWTKPKRLFEKKSLIVDNIPTGIYYFRVNTDDLHHVIPIIVIKD
ncbi:MAG: T9SS C-terminal target domain-containing protein [Flavobacteriales bacterium TMED191]|nr:MAG: T9SS C-terminal target domain-containing protein [Flavobacteriales bacterium TMED191]